jgi:hypothetical protein
MDNHHQIVLVDGQWLLTGGRNTTSEYVHQWLHFSSENFWESLWEKSCEIPIMVDRQGIKGNYEMSDCNDTTVYVSLSGSDCEDEPTQRTVAESV